MRRFSLLSAVLAVFMIVAMCILPAAAMVAQATGENATYYYGDINGNGDVEKFDYIIVKRYVMNTITLDDDQLLRGDVNQNGKIEKFDYILVKRHVMNTYSIPMVSSACKHELEAIAATEATCTENGNIAYYSCKKCSKLFLDADAKTETVISETVIDSLGHTEVTDEYVAPTCSKEGLTEGKHCTVCKTILIAQQTIAKTNHTPGADATCTENQICAVCNEILVSAGGHIPSTGATCTEDQICTVCETVLTKASGHSLTFIPEKAPVSDKEPGNCAYWQCSECKKCYLDEAATQEIAPEDVICKLFKVTYYCDENNTKQVVWYNLGEEVEELLEPQINGYKFKYWTDGYGRRVNSISASNTENIELYAVVEIETYTIYLGGTWKYGDITYTVNDQINLPVPVEDGLTFAGWRDASGRVEGYTDSVGVQRWRIPKGTYGDIELMAQWKDNRNLVVPDTRPAKDRYVNSGYDEAAQTYWFVYSLGEIRNVVLDPESSLTKTTHSGGHIAGSLALAETVTVEESVGKSVSETVSHTVTNSTDWSMTEDWEQSLSAGVGVTVTVGAEVGPEFAKTKVESSLNVSYEASASVGGSLSEGGGNEESDETSNTIETNFAYNTAISQTTERSISFTHDVAPGKYYYANVGIVKVYAFVAYDPVTNTFGLETFSVLSKEASATVLSDKKDDREYVSDALSYDVYIDGINNAVNDNFFIQYFANNGSGESAVKMYPLDADMQISNSMFTYSGYTFENWMAADGTKYNAGDVESNLVGAGKMLVLNAQWSSNKYSVTYNENKPVNASHSVDGMPQDANAVYDVELTLGKAPELVGWTFGGWYLDEACTKRVGTSGEKVSNLTTDANGTVVLYAKWSANSYTVIYNANGGSGVVNNTYHVYDSSSALSNGAGYTRANYTFLGWSANANATTATYKGGQSASTVTTESTITLYAVWVKTNYSIYYNEEKRARLVAGESHTDTIITGFNKQQLLENGYTTVEVVLNFECDGTQWICYNEARVQIKSGNNFLYDYEFGYVFGWDVSSEKLTASLIIDLLANDTSFAVIWSTPDDGNGSGDGWNLGRTTITVTAK